MNTWQASWRLVMLQPRQYLLASLLWAGVHLAPLLPGLITRELFNQLTGGAGLDTTYWILIGLLVGIGAGRLGMLMAAVLAYVPFRFNIDATLRQNMLGAILSRPGAAAIDGSAGEAISRFRGDVDHLSDYASDRLVDLLGLALAPVIGLTILFRVNPQITLAVIAPLLVVITLVNLMRRRLEQYRDARRRAAGRVTGFIGELYGAVQAVKIANATEGVDNHLAELNETRRSAALKDTLLSELLHTAFRSTIDISVGIILILAGAQVGSEAFTLGDFTLFVAFLWPVTDGLTFLGNMLAVQKQTDVSVDRINRLVGDPSGERTVAKTDVYLKGSFPDIHYTPKSGVHTLYELDVHDLSYIHPQSGRGIDGIDLNLQRGSFTVITGRVGSGKTTLLRCLLGLLPTDRGTTVWNGMQVDDPGGFFITPRSAYTPQVPRLFSNTLRENLLMGLAEDQVDIPAAMHAAVFEKDLAELEMGLDTMVGPKGVKLSGGQIQRSAAARMFVRNPELLVFDDLSSALDVDTERTLWERIFADRNDAEMATCLVVSHRRAALQRADHVIVLNDGQIEDEGTLDELLVRSEEMQRLWHGDHGQT